MATGRAPAELPAPDQEVCDLAARLVSHVQELAGRIGSRHAGRPGALEAAARYIEERFVEHHYQVERQPFQAAGTTVANIEARRGAAPNRFFVIGAHYDTVSPAPESIPGVGWSDHWSFWRQGYKALLLTDTAPYRYPHYHAPSDTPDKLDYIRLAWAAQGIATAARELAP